MRQEEMKLDTWDEFYLRVTEFNLQQVRKQLKSLKSKNKIVVEEGSRKEFEMLQYTLLRLQDRFEIDILVNYPKVEGDSFGIAGKKFARDQCTFINYSTLPSLTEDFLSSSCIDEDHAFGREFIKMLQFLGQNSTEQSKKRCILLLLDLNLIMDSDLLTSMEYEEFYNYIQAKKMAINAIKSS